MSSTDGVDDSEVLRASGAGRHVAPTLLASFLLWALSGLLLGVVAKLGDEGGPEWLGDLTTELPFWVAVVALLGWFAPSPAGAGVRCAAFLLAMNLGYYGWAVGVLSHPFETAALGWFVLAGVVCPWMAVATRFARGGGRWGPAALGVAAALVLVTGRLGAWWLQVTGQAFTPGVDDTVQAVLELLMAVLVVAVAGSGRRSLLALAVAVLLYVPAGLAYDAVFARLPLP